MGNFFGPRAAASTTRGYSETGLSVWAPSAYNNDMFKVAIVVQQSIRELTETVSDKDKIMVISKLVRNLMKQKSC
jgi:predicted 2-oxoglutarate/Fe(II)-dependent dioxygenase YbiX